MKKFTYATILVIGGFMTSNALADSFSLTNTLNIHYMTVPSDTDNALLQCSYITQQAVTIADKKSTTTLPAFSASKTQITIGSSSFPAGDKIIFFTPKTPVSLREYTAGIVYNNCIDTIHSPAACKAFTALAVHELARFQCQFVQNK